MVDITSSDVWTSPYHSVSAVQRILPRGTTHARLPGKGEMDFVNKRPTVVIADGSPSFLAVLSKLLQRSFSIVARAEDGDRPFKAIAEFHPQLAIPGYIDGKDQRT